MNEQPRRRRGRPSNAELEARRAAESTDPGYVTVEATPRQEETQQRRRRRDDSGETLNRKLYVPDRFLDHANFAYRWFNDTAGGRIQEKTIFDDWDIVTTDMLGEEYKLAAAARDMGDGNSIRRQVGSENGRPLYAYFCRKRKEFHEEDQLKKRRAIQETEEAMRRGPLPSTEGIGPEEGYVPRGHRNVVAGR